MKINGTRIKQHREAKGLTQSEMAYLLNISQPFLSKLESGFIQPKFELLIKIASFLGVDVNDIIDDTISSDLTTKKQQSFGDKIFNRIYLKAGKTD
jgi:transcriptional regulator with XRE-family HTH domain